MYKTWTNEQEQYLRQYYYTVPLNELSKIYGKSEKAISCKARKMGMRKVRTGSYALASKYTFKFNSGAPMEEALTPGQCSEVRDFLKYLVSMHRKLKWLDIGMAMKLWREGAA